MDNRVRVIYHLFYKEASLKDHIDAKTRKQSLSYTDLAANGDRQLFEVEDHALRWLKQARLRLRWRRLNQLFGMEEDPEYRGFHV